MPAENTEAAVAWQWQGQGRRVSGMFNGRVFDQLPRFRKVTAELGIVGTKTFVKWAISDQPGQRCGIGVASAKKQDRRHASTGLLLKKLGMIVCLVKSEATL